MKNIKSLLSFFFIIAILFVGCKKDESTPTTPTPTINEAEELVKYVEANGDYIHAGAGFTYDAATFRTDYLANPGKLLILDIRSATDYNAKHLLSAKNITLANLRKVTDTVNFANYDKIVVVCYSGQTACYGVGLVRSLYSLTNANKIVALKWGMSSIDSMFATNYWLAKISNGRATQFVQTAAPTKPAKGDLPTLSTGKKTGQEILSVRVDSLLAQGFTVATVSEGTVYSGLTNYFIVNYWPSASYLNPGHIDGAYNYDNTTKPFQLANDLKTLPTNKTIALYCYTGQTSAYVGAYLRLIGYDVKSITYGANSMIYDLMTANKFNPLTEIKGYKDLLTP